ncbi:GcvT family protein [Neptunomonas antarctica]|uniref:4-methylaminobutanoate oxidase (Formaldehyde-forming) n=1 Tax=Neptunomonas antarctica TaxID=619304 RepID=A0A1N7KYT7_9GAMM|nr:FAD-dependent oxidoreductase [Neptunomonas antarctica]SIS66748.1 4-methylaminobutanoate oxidase (formaldehyde-forming) [Neptunomonas antarctica]
MTNKNQLPAKASVVIIGGGIVGCSIAYHLAKRGIKDVVVLERKQLTCGTTWHAAGLVSMLWPTPYLTSLAKYSHELYASLEEETGQATGYRQIGSLSVARSAERLEELRRTSSMAAVFGVESEMIDNERLAELYPGINTDGIAGALYIEKDGQTNPVDTTMALAKGARMRGARVIENVKVEEILVEGGQAVGVKTAQGSIVADKVVLAGGLWSRDIAANIGVDLPLYACEHYYVVTEEMDGLTKRPVLRDFDKGVYFKEDAGKMLVGWFEHNARGCSMDRIREDFCFDEFPCDIDHIEEYLMRSMEAFPALEETGIRTFFNGPESFTPDNLHLLGPTPEVDNFYVACGLNSKGIGAGGGLGMLMADWIIDGHPSGDIWECDVRRHNPAQRTQSYIEERIPEALGHTYAMHWPFYQYETARDRVRSPLHEVLEAQNACFGEVGGFERPNWFAQDGAEAKYQYSYKRQNWFEFSATEHRSIRENVGVYDISSFGKFEVSGPDAEKALQWICAGDVVVEQGSLVYTQWLNPRGGIEADVTLSKLDTDRYMVTTGISSLNRDWWHLKKNLQGDVQLRDISADYACLSLQGPNARAVLETLADTDISSEGFVFGTGRFAKVAGVDVWLQRLSYVGELGWEIFVPAAKATGFYRELQKAGAAFELRNVGMHALNSLRLEKGFRHWGHDIGSEDNLLQAGLSFAAKPDASDFMGRDAFLLAKAPGIVDRRLVQFQLNDPEPLLYHNEPIVMDGGIVGYLTSGMYGHSVGAAIGMGYVDVSGLTKDRIAAANFEIEVAKQRFSAQASLRALYDPSGSRMKI